MGWVKATPEIFPKRGKLYWFQTIYDKRPLLGTFWVFDGMPVFEEYNKDVAPYREEEVVAWQEVIVPEPYEESVEKDER